MLEFLNGSIDPDIAKNLLREAAQSDFARQLALFGLAAYIHGSQVRKEVKQQFTELISVLRQDLDATKSVLAGVVKRVDDIEAHMKGE